MYRARYAGPGYRELAERFTAAAAELELSGEERDAIAQLAPAPPPATDRSEERRGITYGRERSAPLTADRR